jgi:hypothetical protein
MCAKECPDGVGGTLVVEDVVAFDLAALIPIDDAPEFVAPKGRRGFATLETPASPVVLDLVLDTDIGYNLQCNGTNVPRSQGQMGEF